MGLLVADVSTGTPIAYLFCYPVTPIGPPGSQQITCSVDGEGAPATSTHYYNAQHFLEFNSAFNKYHLGDDWNGNGGGDTDYGDPVYAVADGTVTFVQDLAQPDNTPDSWGKVVVIRHVLPDGQNAWSLYAHLQYWIVPELCHSSSSTLCEVRKGQQIGAIGNGNGYYAGLTHLHFEMRKRFVFNDLDIIPGHGYISDPLDPFVAQNYYDPTVFIEARRADSCVVPRTAVPGSTTHDMPDDASGGTPCPPEPTVTLTANPGTVNAGGSTTLSWNSSDATSCMASGGWSGSRPTSGSSSVSPTATSTYTLTCSGPGGSASDSVTVAVNSSPGTPAVYLSAFPETVTAGAAVGLGWATSNVTSCTASGGWSGSRPLSGGTTVFPSTTTLYTLTCSGPGGSASASVTVTVTSSNPSVNLAVTPPAIDPGGSATLQWTTTAMTSCSASGGWSGSKPLNGSQQVSPASTTTYTLNCTGTAPPSQELARNGGFSGTVTEWTLTGSFFANSNFGSCNLTCPGYAYLSHSSGSLSLSNNLFGSMSQDINLPSAANSITLSFWVSISTLETSTTTPFDVLSVAAIDGQGTSHLVQTFSNLNAGGYRLTTFNLTPYKGQTVRLQFVGTTNATNGTVFRVDDVSVQAAFPAQQYSKSATLTVNSPPPPSLVFTADPDLVAAGQPSTLAWSSSGATSCIASDGWSGNKPTSGNQVVTPTATTTYSLSCSGAGGTVSSNVTVVLQAPPAGYPIHVSTGVADQITQTSALLHGIANPNGAATSAHFLYGPFPALGYTSSSANLGAGTTDQTFAVTVSGLSCGTRYQYLADATNAFGESNGAARTFDTLACSAVIPAPCGRALLQQPRGGFGGCDESQDSGGGTVAENFRVATADHIDCIELLGYYWPGNDPPPLSTFRVALYRVTAEGYPGETILQGSGIPAFREMTGVVSSFGLNEWRFWLGLVYPPRLAPGDYFIEVAGNATSGGGFCWEGGAQDPVSGLPGIAYKNTGSPWALGGWNDVITLWGRTIARDGFESGDLSFWTGVSQGQAIDGN